jgi:transcriptional regulator with XRE-family HTH domain
VDSVPTTRFDPSVGQRLRELRQARGVSLSALARAAGIGKATLSGLEHGTRNPTLETLYAIAAALDVPLASLVTARLPAAVAPGAAVEGHLLQVYEEPTATFELYRLRIVPGATQTSPAHPTGVVEHVTVFQGVLRAGPVDAPLLAGPGEHLVWTSDVPHLYRVESEEDVHASLLIRTPC